MFDAPEAPGLAMAALELRVRIEVAHAQTGVTPADEDWSAPEDPTSRGATQEEVRRLKKDHDLLSLHGIDEADGIGVPPPLMQVRDAVDPAGRGLEPLLLQRRAGPLPDLFGLIPILRVRYEERWHRGPSLLVPLHCGFTAAHQRRQDARPSSVAAGTSTNRPVVTS